MEGYLKIKTKIDNKDVDKGIIELENKIKKLQEDNTKQTQKQDDLQQEINKYEEMCSELDKYKQKIQDLETQKKSLVTNGHIKASLFPQYGEISSKISQAKTEQAQLNSETNQQASRLKNVYRQLEQIKNKQRENNTKIAEYKQKIEQINIKNIQKDINNVGKGITGQINKLGKMAMAIVGIRTALTAVTRVVNMVKQYNPQISTDFQYIGYCIANSVVPAVQKLVQLLYKALSYVNAITSAWFGINLFGNSSVKNFQKMQKSAGGTAKSAKEIQKSLQGFDEMNVLQDSSAKSNEGISSPSLDLSNIQGDVPKWLQWIIDNKDLILSILGGIGAGILAIKLGLGGIKALGIGVLITGVIYIIQSLIKYLNDPSWENFGKIIQGIGVAIIGLAVLIGSIPLAVAGAVVLIVGIIVQYWNQIKDFLQNGINWLISKTDWIEENFGLLGKIIYQRFIDILQELLNMFDGIFKGVKTILDGILQVFKGIFTGDMKTVLNGFKQIFKGVFDTLWSIAKVPLNLIIRGVNTLIRGANKIHFDMPSWVPNIGGKTFGINIPQIPLLAKGGIISQPTQAIIGEAGKEAVVPLENNMDWLDMLADRLASKIENSGASFVINMDGRMIQRGMAKRQQELAFAKNGR